MLRVGRVEGLALARSRGSALAGERRSSRRIPDIEPGLGQPSTGLAGEAGDPHVGIAAGVRDVPDLEEAADDRFLVDPKVLLGGRLGQPEGREDRRQSIPQRTEVGAQLGIGAAGPWRRRLEHATDRLEPAAELADQPVDIVFGDPGVDQRPHRADEGLVARIEPAVGERPDLADRHQPFHQREGCAGLLGKLGDGDGPHAAMVRGATLSGTERATGTRRRATR